MAWRIARALDKLLAEINAFAPKRNKASDGGIGDDNHANRDSDHNPWYGPGIVTARDYTHDPANGADMNVIADKLIASRDPRIKYIIWNRRILGGKAGPSPWVWRPYNGSNAHTKHLHLSVVGNALCDDVSNWNLGGSAPVNPPTGRPILKRGSKGQPVMDIQRKFNSVYPAYSKLTVDGDFGPATEKVVKEFQRRSGLAADGIVGPNTYAKLGM